MGTSSSFSVFLPLGFIASPLINIVSCLNRYVNTFSSLISDVRGGVALGLLNKNNTLSDKFIGVSVVSSLMTSYRKETQATYYNLCFWSSKL